MELYTIPIPNADQDNAYIVYRPLLGLAFIGNQVMADLAKSLAEDPIRPMDDDVHAFLEKIGFLCPDPPMPQPPALGDFNPIGRIATPQQEILHDSICPWKQDTPPLTIPTKTSKDKTTPSSKFRCMAAVNRLSPGRR